MSFLHRSRTYSIIPFQSCDCHFAVVNLKIEKEIHLIIHASENINSKDIRDERTAINVQLILKYGLALMHCFGEVAITDFVHSQRKTIPSSYFLQYEQILVVIIYILGYPEITISLKGQFNKTTGKKAKEI